MLRSHFVLPYKSQEMHKKLDTNHTLPAFICSDLCKILCSLHYFKIVQAYFFFRFLKNNSQRVHCKQDQLNCPTQHVHVKKGLSIENSPFSNHKLADCSPTKPWITLGGLNHVSIWITIIFLKQIN